MSTSAWAPRAWRCLPASTTHFSLEKQQSSCGRRLAPTQGPPRSPLGREADRALLRVLRGGLAVQHLPDTLQGRLERPAQTLDGDDDLLECRQGEAVSASHPPSPVRVRQVGVLYLQVGVPGLGRGHPYLDDIVEPGRTLDESRIQLLGIVGRGDVQNVRHLQLAIKQ